MRLLYVVHRQNFFVHAEGDEALVFIFDIDEFQCVFPDFFGFETAKTEHVRILKCL